jgi:hypothetical protein
MAVQPHCPATAAATAPTRHTTNALTKNGSFSGLFGGSSIYKHKRDGWPSGGVCTPPP